MRRSESAGPAQRHAEGNGPRLLQDNAMFQGRRCMYNIHIKQIYIFIYNYINIYIYIYIYVYNVCVYITYSCSIVFFWRTPYLDPTFGFGMIVHSSDAVLLTFGAYSATATWGFTLQVPDSFQELSPSVAWGKLLRNISFCLFVLMGYMFWLLARCFLWATYKHSKCGSSMNCNSLHIVWICLMMLVSFNSALTGSLEHSQITKANAVILWLTAGRRKAGALCNTTWTLRCVDWQLTCSKTV